MTDPSLPDLSRRERQIMDIVYARGRASAADVREALPDAPSDSAVRTLLRLLEEKGHLTHAKEGRKFVYAPVVAATQVRRSALKKLVHTFFEGSVEEAMASLLDLDSRGLSNSEIDRMSALIEGARKKGETS